MDANTAANMRHTGCDRPHIAEAWWALLILHTLLTMTAPDPSPSTVIACSFNGEVLNIEGEYTGVTITAQASQQTPPHTTITPS